MTDIRALGLSPYMARLRAAAQNARDPFASAPITAAPAYAASTSYITGSIVTNAGNLYVAVNTGTSPASPTAPTHTSGSATTDGAVLWTYFGPAAPASTESNLPSVSVSSSAPGLGNVFSPLPANGSYAAGAVAPIGGYVYNYGGYPGLYTLNKAAGQPIGQHCSWEFETDDPSVAIGVFGNGSPVQLTIDGRRYAPGGLRMVVSGENWITIAFPRGERATHRVRVAISNPNMALKDVRVSSNGMVWAPQSDKVRAVFLSDSIFQGSGFGPVISGGSAPERVAAAMGWDDPWDFSLGGTGYTNPGASLYTYAQRVPEALTLNPDIWVLMGSTNDNGVASATITAAALATLQAIRAGSPAPIVVLGVWPVAGASATTETAVQAAVTQFADVQTRFVAMANDAVPWITGAWNNTGRTGSSNSAQLIGGDGTHPVDGGTAYLAHRAAAAIRRAVFGQ